MNEAIIRELFLTDWVQEATTEEIVKKLVENDERYKEIKRLKQELQRKDNIINELKNELYHIYNYAGLETKDLEDKIKELEERKGNK